MEKHSTPPCGELLSCGKVARADIFPCGHIVLAFDTLKIAFAREDFTDFAHTIALALSNLSYRDIERAQWGLFM
ncbi:MAG: hypothetical protein LDLANPLL_02543 [Turneriella sp.]|nr:hypothetical protein [Turneriella sp.]